MYVLGGIHAPIMYNFVKNGWCPAIKFSNSNDAFWYPIPGAKIQ